MNLSVHPSWMVPCPVSGWNHVHWHYQCSWTLLSIDRGLSTFLMRSKRDSWHFSTHTRARYPLAGPKLTRCACRACIKTDAHAIMYVETLRTHRDEAKVLAHIRLNKVGIAAGYIPSWPSLHRERPHSSHGFPTVSARIGIAELIQNYLPITRKQHLPWFSRSFVEARDSFRS